MPEKEKKTEEGTKKRARKTSRKGAAKRTEKEPSQPQLDRDQLESLREKLQRKYH